MFQISNMINLSRLIYFSVFDLAGFCSSLNFFILRIWIFLFECFLKDTEREPEFPFCWWIEINYENEKNCYLFFIKIY